MKKIITCLIFIMAIMTVVITVILPKNKEEVADSNSDEELYYSFDYEVNPETFSVKMVKDKEEYYVSKAQKKTTDQKCR